MSSAGTFRDCGCLGSSFPPLSEAGLRYSPATLMNTLQRDSWPGHPVYLGEGFRSDFSRSPTTRRMARVDVVWKAVSQVSPTAMSNATTLRREFWNGQSEQLRELFPLKKQTGAHAQCSLWSHPLGFELRLSVDN